MCEALEKMMKEMRQESLLRGQALGEALGEARGAARGEARGEMKERRKNAKALFQRGMSIREIAEVIDEKEATVESWLEAAGR